jgi:hypothetical protein
MKFNNFTEESFFRLTRALMGDPWAGRASFQWQLKSSCDNARHRDVFIQFLPTERVAIQFQADLRELIVRS